MAAKERSVGVIAVPPPIEDLVAVNVEYAVLFVQSLAADVHRQSRE